MKQLTCEMCGSTDLLKQEGVFVCQTCGTKYSVEEAKKMMIEGTVEVTGTVTVDKSNEAENLLIVARRSMKEGNYDVAADNFSRALQIDPNNWEANFYRSYCATMNSNMLNIVSNFNSTCTTAMSSISVMIKNEDFSKDSCLEIVEQIGKLSILTLYNKIMSYSKNPEHIEIVGNRYRICNNGGFDKLCNDIASIISSLIKVYQPCSALDVKILKTITKSFDDFYKMLDSMPTLPTMDSETLRKILVLDMYGKEEAYRAASNYSNRQKRADGIKEGVLSAKKGFEDIIKKMEQKEKEAKEKERQEKIAAYWEEHAEEKQQLESEKNAILEEIEHFKSQLTPLEDEIFALRREREKDVPSQAEKNTVLDEINKLRTEMNGLGIFKGKEKKALQEQIDELNARITTLNLAIEQEEKEQIKACNEKISEVEERMKPIKDDINKLQTRLAEINDELTKDRSEPETVSE